jgi:hypothetical protein
VREPAVIGLAALLWIAGCSPAPESIPDARVIEAAQTYAAWGHADEQFRYAVADCAWEPSSAPPRMSESGDLQAHGRKLYYLFAKDAFAYLNSHRESQPGGQVLVKESWIPEGGGPIAAGPLFMMLKTGGKDTDEGWIYATTAPDRKTITASGKIASCMNCHRKAPRDRMFGLPWGSKSP